MDSKENIEYIMVNYDSKTDKIWALLRVAFFLIFPSIILIELFNKPSEIMFIALVVSAFFFIFLGVVFNLPYFKKNPLKKITILHSSILFNFKNDTLNFLYSDVLWFKSSKGRYRYVFIKSANKHKRDIFIDEEFIDGEKYDEFTRFLEKNYLSESDYYEKTI